MDVIILKSEPKITAVRIDLDRDEALRLRAELVSLQHNCNEQPLVCRILRSDLAAIPNKEGSTSGV